MTTPGHKKEPESKPPPLSPEQQETLNTISRILRGKRVRHGAVLDLPALSVISTDLREVCGTLRSYRQLDFDLLLCLLAVDYKDYIQMVYVLYSLGKGHTIVLKTDLAYEDLTIETVADIWRTAEWYEREAHDLFGVNFKGNPNLKPLLLYEGFEGFPGRKEFPFNEYDEF